MSDIRNEFSDMDDRSIRIFDILQKQGKMTKNMLAEKAKVKKSTLNRTLDNLLNNNLIIREEVGESTGGRKPIIFDINPKKYYLIGIDISRTYIQIVIINLKMQIIAEKIYYGNYLLDESVKIISDFINNLNEIMKINIKDIIGIGIGAVVSGIMPERNLSDKNSFKIKDILEKSYNLPVFIDNGANTAVIAEYYFGYGKEKESVSYINCGVGIRTGVISGGVLIRSVNDHEDALGHMIVDIDGDLCTCGNYGCVEAYSSIINIRNKYISEIKKGKRTDLNKLIDDVDYIDICGLADNNDETAKNILTDAAVYFGTGLANFIKLLNTKTIILSGPLVSHSSLFYIVSREIALKKCHAVDINNVEFYRSGYFKDKSIAVGAAYLVYENIVKNRNQQ